MRRQRTLFFGRKPAKTPREDGDNPPVPDRRHAALNLSACPAQAGMGELDIRFDNDTATQFDGYPLWHAFATRVDLNAKLAQHLSAVRQA